MTYLTGCCMISLNHSFLAWDISIFGYEWWIFSCHSHKWDFVSSSSIKIFRCAASWIFICMIDLGTVHLKSGRGAVQFGTCCVWNTMATFNSCVFFLDPPLFIVRKIMAPTEYFPENLEENVNVKMVLIVENARFAIAIGLIILHSSVLKMRLKVFKICLRHFHKFGQASSCNCTVFPAMYDYPCWKDCQETF